MLDSEIIWRPVKINALKIASYILACCNVKDKTQLQITHNIDTQNYLHRTAILWEQKSQNIMKNYGFFSKSHDVGLICAPPS